MRWASDHGTSPQSALSGLRISRLRSVPWPLSARGARSPGARRLLSILQARTAVGGPWPCAGPLPLLGSAAGHTHLTRDTTRGHRLGETSPVNTRRRHHRQSGAERTRKAVGTHMRRRRPPLKIHALRPRTLPCAPPYLVPCALISGCTSRHSHHHTAAPPSVNASSAKHPLGNLPRTLPEAAAKGGGNSRPRYSRPQ